MNKEDKLCEYIENLINKANILHGVHTHCVPCNNEIIDGLTKIGFQFLLKPTKFKELNMEKIK